MEIRKINDLTADQFSRVRDLVDSTEDSLIDNTFLRQLRDYVYYRPGAVLDEKHLTFLQITFDF